MSILFQLERDLDEAARRIRANQDPDVHTASPAARSRVGRGRLLIRRELRHARVLLLSFAGLLATAAIALAATGVIPIGSPVHSRAKPNPRVGVGIPAKGSAHLLAVRAADPEGGLPWGLRLVRTTRGELCLQLGRVEDGKLGQLGIDGAFNDDGSFHPIGRSDLPRPALGFRGMAADEETICHLPSASSVDVNPTAERRNATGQWRRVPRTPPPLSELRDVYYGLLGARAVSITYQDGSSTRTIPVERGTGAYIIVMPARRGLLLHSGDGGTVYESNGTISPSSDYGVIDAVTYRIDGQLCQRGARSTRGTEHAVAHRCPVSHSSPPLTRASPRELHKPVKVELHVQRHVVIGATVSFRAPFAVESARDEYEVMVQNCGTTGVRITSGRLMPIDRDVARGERISDHWSHPFVACNAKAITFDVLYEQMNPGLMKPVIVGSITVPRPPHTHAVRHRTR